MTKDCDARERGGRMLVDAGYKKRRKGGAVPGESAKERPDRRARGGKIGKGKVVININAGGGKEPVPVPIHPPMAGPGLGAVPPGAGMPPRPMVAPGGAPMGGPPRMPMRPPMAPPGGPMMPPRRDGGMVRRDAHGRFKGGAV